MKSKTKIKNTPSKALDELEKLNKSLRGNNAVRVGLPKGSNAYPDGTSVIMVGAVHEFGSPSRGVPQRSYLRSTLNTKRPNYKEMFKKLGRQIVQGTLSKKKALGLLGLQLQTDVREKITDIDTPELKHREGNPLIDTGHLRDSITYEVEA